MIVRELIKKLLEIPDQEENIEIDELENIMQEWEEEEAKKLYKLENN